MSSGGGSSSSTQGYRYYMKLLFGLCRGPIDELVEIRVGDKTAWPLNGETTYSSAGEGTINASDLFGGEKQEGGIKGAFHLLFGAADQVVPSGIKSALGGLVPGHRGVSTFFYDGLVSCMNPYPKKWSFRRRRILNGWDGDVWNPDYAKIVLSDSDGNIIHSMNGAHIIYECLTNRSWGRGLPRSAIDEISFREAADTLYGESFGLCLEWKRDGTIGDFLSTVIDHIGASLYSDRTTGLLTLKLIRGDYDVDGLPTFTYNSGLLSVEVDETGSREDSINEVIVNFKNPVDGEQHSVRAHNLASVQTLGWINTTTKDYSGLPTTELATRVAQRDLRAQTAALKRYTLKIDRRAWKAYPGSVFAFSDPSRNIEKLVLRAGKCTDGSLAEGSVTVEAVLDVFGMPVSTMTSTQPTSFTPQSKVAVPLTRRLVQEANYRDFRQAGETPTDITMGSIAVCGARPDNSTVYCYDLMTRTGTADFKDRGTDDFTPYGVMTNSIGLYDTLITYSSDSDIEFLEAGNAVQVGTEIMRVDGINTTLNHLTVTRGCIDTVPVAHSSGSAIFCVDNYQVSDGVTYTLGTSVDVKLRSRSSSSQLDLDLAPTDTVAIVARQARPYPPANVLLNGQLAGMVSAVEGAFSVSWVSRNRVTQDDILVGHTDDNVTAESGTTYTLDFKNGTNTVMSYSGMDVLATSVTLYEDSSALTMEVSSSRSGLKSFQSFKCTFSYIAPTIVAVTFPGRRMALIGDSITNQNTAYYKDSAVEYFSYAMVGYYSFLNALMNHPFELEMSMQPDTSYEGYKNGYNFAIAGSKVANWWDASFSPLPDGVVQRGPMNAAQLHPSKFDVVITMGGTNDVAGDIDAATILANMKRVVKTWTAAGKWVFIMTLTPRSASYFDGYDFAKIAVLQQRIKDINQGLRDWFANESPVNAWLVDTWNDLVGANGTDPHGVLSNTVTAGGDDTMYTNWNVSQPHVIFFGDGLHPVSAGAYVIAKKLKTAMNAAGIPAITSSPAWPLTRGTNLHPNPTFSGTGGYTTIGTLLTPDEWLLFRSSNSDGVSFSNFNYYTWQSFVSNFPVVGNYMNDSTFADSALASAKVTLGDGRTGWRLTFSTPQTGNANESIVIRCVIPERAAAYNEWDQTLNTTETPYNPGDKIEGGIELHLSNINNLWTCKLQLDFLSVDLNNSSTYSAKISAMSMGQNLNTPTVIPHTKFYPEDQILYLKTPVVTTPTPSATETLQYCQFNLHVSLDASTGPASVTMILVDPYFRIITGTL